MSNQDHLDVDSEVPEEEAFNENFKNYVENDENLETRSNELDSIIISKPVHNKNDDKGGRI